MVYQGNRNTFIARSLEGIEALYRCLEKNPMPTKFYKIETSCKDCGFKEIQSTICKIRDYCHICAPKHYVRPRQNQRIAHTMVTSAIQNRKLIRPLICSVCGLSQEKAIIAHHDDYLKPLDIRWLCSGCHYEWHSRNGPGLNR